MDHREGRSSRFGSVLLATGLGFRARGLGLERYASARRNIRAATPDHCHQRSRRSSGHPIHVSIPNAARKGNLVGRERFYAQFSRRRGVGTSSNVVRDEESAKGNPSRISRRACSTPGGGVSRYLGPDVYIRATCGSCAPRAGGNRRRGGSSRESGQRQCLLRIQHDRPRESPDAELI